MAMCPNCNHKIAFWQLLTLTNFNTITCTNCNIKLRAKLSRSRLIGGIGGGLGALALPWAYNLWAWTSLLLIGGWIVLVVLLVEFVTRLETVNFLIRIPVDEAGEEGVYAMSFKGGSYTLKEDAIYNDYKAGEVVRPQKQSGLLLLPIKPKNN